MKFMNLSPDADFYSKFQSQLTVISGNVLYTTHQIDKILKIINKLDVDKGLQKQVDQYFDEDGDEIETSPQTDSSIPKDDDEDH